MKTKLIVFALFISLFSLGGCVATGPGYGYDGGYYPSAQPYYGYGSYGRPYYAPRPVIIGRPVYRQPYRSNGGYRGDGGYHGGPRGGNPGGGYHGGNGGGGYHGGGGHGRGR